MGLSRVEVQYLRFIVEFLLKLSIRKRLFLGFGFVLLMMVILTILGIQKVNFIDSTLTVITDVNSVKQRHAIDYRGSVHDRAIAIRDVVLSKNPSQLNGFINEISQLQSFYKEAETMMRNMRNDGVEFDSDELRILNKIDAVQNRTLPLIRQIIEATQNQQQTEAQDILLNQARPAFIDWLASINQFIDYQERANQSATPLAREATGGFQTLMLLLSAIAIVIGIVVAKLIESSLLHSLGGEPYEAAEAVSKIAAGNLLDEVKSDYPDSMLSSLCNMRSRLSDIVSSIAESSKELSTQTTSVVSGSKFVFDAAQTQSQLTTETAKQLEDMQVILEQISHTVSQTEKNSSQTTEFAKQGKNSINSSATEMERISQTVNSTVEQIRKLEDSTKEIGNIVNVISSISDQTNLLALNAAIEAARAGESGRGFAVVADEVRQLAKRTGEATNQIENMINEVQKETAASVLAMEKTQPLVENGRALTIETTELLELIENHANDSLSNVHEVAVATDRQTMSIKEIAGAMVKVNQMSLESIASLRKNSEATESLNSLSIRLMDNVSFFQVKNS